MVPMDLLRQKSYVTSLLGDDETTRRDWGVDGRGGHLSLSLLWWCCGCGRSVFSLLTANTEDNDDSDDEEEIPTLDEDDKGGINDGM